MPRRLQFNWYFCCIPLGIFVIMINVKKEPATINTAAGSFLNSDTKVT